MKEKSVEKIKSYRQEIKTHHCKITAKACIFLVPTSATKDSMRGAYSTLQLTKKARQLTFYFVVLSIA